MSEKGKNVAVVGAGLCGSLLALRLKQLGYEPVLFEKRPDMRSTDISAGRSINLALSNRGLKALELVGLSDKAKSITLPMKGRLLHDRAGNLRMSPYSGRPDDYINSISRGDLNSILYDAAEAQGIPIHFNMGCISSDPDSGELKFQDQSGNIQNFRADAVFGADGAGSVIRQAAMKRSSSLRFNFSQQYLTHGYKELSIPASDDNDFRIASDALHIWPRKTFMMIGLPNLDKTFTITLFLPFAGEDGFDNIRTDADVTQYFQKWFPDAMSHMPHLLEEYRTNPTSSLGTIKCFPWKTGERTLLIGDAAHAIVPFYGQGMNCSFEDVVVLDKVMKNFEYGDWGNIFEAFQSIRKKDADAIADLALDNFIEMRDKVDDPIFAEKRKLEMKLENKYPDYYSKYSLVTFKEDLPYSAALKLGRAQDDMLLQKISKNGSADQIDETKILQELLALRAELEISI